MTRRFGVLVLLMVAPGVVCAAEVPVSLNTCQNDLVMTGEYAALLRPQRDAYEIEIARLRAHVKLLDAEVARLKGEAAAPKPGTTP